MTKYKRRTRRTKNILKECIDKLSAISSLPNADAALEDLLDEMEKIHKYYLAKSLKFANNMHIISEIKQIPYDPID